MKTANFIVPVTDIVALRCVVAATFVEKLLQQIKMRITCDDTGQNKEGFTHKKLKKKIK